MINKEMKDHKSNVEGNKGQSGTRKPNENAGVYFSSSIKIFDPNTEEVLVQKRGDD